MIEVNETSSFKREFLPSADNSIFDIPIGAYNDQTFNNEKGFEGLSNLFSIY